jgi:predicted RNA-binding Zn-ribbon protein involved in translation (DUF1610 family)
MSDDARPVSRARQRRRPRAGLAAGQVLLAAVAIVVFLWLVNILQGEGDGRVLPDVADALSDNAWIAVCIVSLGVILVLEVLLLRPGMRRAVLAPQAWTPQPRPQEWHDDPIPEPAAPEHLIGCPACGTVFDATANAGGEGQFSCPNCGRVGRLRRSSPVAANLHDIDCPRCAHHYQAYQSESECPNCGQANRIRSR